MEVNSVREKAYARGKPSKEPPFKAKNEMASSSLRSNNTAPPFSRDAIYSTSNMGYENEWSLGVSPFLPEELSQLESEQMDKKVNAEQMKAERSTLNTFPKPRRRTDYIRNGPRDHSKMVKSWLKTHEKYKSVPPPDMDKEDTTWHISKPEDGKPVSSGDVKSDVQVKEKVKPVENDYVVVSLPRRFARPTPKRIGTLETASHPGSGKTSQPLHNISAVDELQERFFERLESMDEDKLSPSDMDQFLENLVKEYAASVSHFHSSSAGKAAAAAKLPDSLIELMKDAENVEAVEQLRKEFE